MAKNKEMKESLKKFKEEAEKLEQSDALKAARQKFETVEKEATKSGDVLKEKLSTIKGRVQEVIDEAGKTDIAKKAGKLTEELSKTTHSLGEKAQEIGKTGAFQSISKATEAVKKEIDTTSMQGKDVYQNVCFIFSRDCNLYYKKKFKKNFFKNVLSPKKVLLYSFLLDYCHLSFFIYL